MAKDNVGDIISIRGQLKILLRASSPAEVLEVVL
jgi:hypothetical protein